MEEQVERKETDAKKELTDAEILEMWSPSKVKAEFDSLHVTPGWIAFIQGLRALNIIAGVLLLITIWLVITGPSGPEAIGLIGLFAPMLLVTVVYWINIIASVLFILTYRPKGNVLYISVGVLLISAGLLYFPTLF